MFHAHLIRKVNDLDIFIRYIRKVKMGYYHAKVPPKRAKSSSTGNWIQRNYLKCVFIFCPT